MQQLHLGHLLGAPESDSMGRARGIDPYSAPRCSEAPSEAVVGLVPAHLAREVPQSGAVVDHEQFGSRDLGEVLKGDLDSGRNSSART